MIRNIQGGDLVTSGEHFATGQEATRQGIIRRLRLFLGEYFLNATDGTPWFESILGKTARDVAEAQIKRRIISAPGVLGISAFSLEFEAQERLIRVQASVIDQNSELVSISLEQRME